MSENFEALMAILQPRIVTPILTTRPAEVLLQDIDKAG